MTISLSELRYSDRRLRRDHFAQKSSATGWGSPLKFAPTSHNPRNHKGDHLEKSALRFFCARFSHGRENSGTTVMFAFIAMNNAQYVWEATWRPYSRLAHLNVSRFLPGLFEILTASFLSQEFCASPDAAEACARLCEQQRAQVALIMSLVVSSGGRPERQIGVYSPNVALREQVSIPLIISCIMRTVCVPTPVLLPSPPSIQNSRL